MNKTVRILSIDGGGIRGILPATFLSVLEEKLQETSGNKDLRLAEYFDLIAGTSTGGLLTCMYLTPDDNNALVPKYTARQALEFYFGYGDSAFTPNKQEGFHKYSSAGLEAGLNKFFDNLLLAQLIKPCCITAYDMLHCKPYLFFSHRAISDPRANYYVKDVARATSALPGIFPPATISSLADRKRTFIDGSIFAYNPALQAYIHAKSIFPNVEKFLLLSLGTGLPATEYTPAQLEDTSEKNWARLLADVSFSAHGDMVHYQLEEIFKGKTDSNYIRLQPLLHGLNKEMDNVSQENVHALYKAGLEFVSSNDKTITELVNSLQNSK
jgi:patatin-like phospholipase/acyl hydrolase